MLLSGSALASGLGSLGEKPWLGVWVGRNGRSFDFAIRTDGASEIHLKKGGKRASIHSFFAVRYVLEEKIGAKWVRRQLAKESLESAQESSLEAEKALFTASFTGETKIAIAHEFEKSEVFVAVNVLEKMTKNPVRVGVEVVVPDFYRHIKADEKERDLKKSLKGHDLQMVRNDGKKVKLDEKVLSKVNLKLESPDLLGTNTVKLFEIKSVKMDGRELSLTTEEDDYGELELRQTKPLFHGLSVLWWPKEDKIGQDGCRLVIKVR